MPAMFQVHFRRKPFLIAEQGRPCFCHDRCIASIYIWPGIVSRPLFAKFGIQRTSVERLGIVATAALDFACYADRRP
jgi:hypothetical protein